MSSAPGGFDSSKGCFGEGMIRKSNADSGKLLMGISRSIGRTCQGVAGEFWFGKM